MKPEKIKQTFTERLRSEKPERKFTLSPGAFYRRYYEDFLEYNEIEADGKVVIRRVYQGTWYTADLDRRGRIRYKAAIAAAWILEVALFGVLIYYGTSLDARWYMAVAHFVAAAGILWNFAAVASCLLAPEKMTHYEYKTSVRDYRISSTLMASGFGVSAVISFITALTPGNESRRLLLLLALGYLAAAGIMFLANRYSLPGGRRNGWRSVFLVLQIVLELVEAFDRVRMPDRDQRIDGIQDRDLADSGIQRNDPVFGFLAGGCKVDIGKLA